jgi:hypothetical protein
MSTQERGFLRCAKASVEWIGLVVLLYFALEAGLNGPMGRWMGLFSKTPLDDPIELVVPISVATDPTHILLAEDSSSKSLPISRVALRARLLPAAVFKTDAGDVAKRVTV